MQTKDIVLLIIGAVVGAVLGVGGNLLANVIWKKKEETVTATTVFLFSLRVCFSVLFIWAAIAVVYLSANDYSKTASSAVDWLMDCWPAVLIAAIFSYVILRLMWERQATAKALQLVEHNMTRNIAGEHAGIQKQLNDLNTQHQEAVTQLEKVKNASDKKLQEAIRQLEQTTRERDMLKDETQHVRICQDPLQCVTDAKDRNKLIAFDRECLPDVKLYGDMRPLVPSLPYEFVLEDGYSKAFQTAIATYELNDYSTWHQKLKQAHHDGELHFEELPFVFLVCAYTPTEVIRQTFANLLRLARSNKLDDKDKDFINTFGGEAKVAEVVRKGWKGVECLDADEDKAKLHQQLIQQGIVARANHYFPHFSQLANAHRELVKALQLLGPAQGMTNGYARTAICRLLLDRVDHATHSQTTIDKFKPGQLAIDSESVEEEALKIFLELNDGVPCYAVNVEDVIRLFPPEDWKAPARYPFTDFAIIKINADKGNTSIEVWDFYADSHILLVHGRKPICAMNRVEDANKITGYELLMKHAVDHVKNAPVTAPYKELANIGQPVTAQEQ